MNSGNPTRCSSAPTGSTARTTPRRRPAATSPGSRSPRPHHAAAPVPRPTAPAAASSRPSEWPTVATVSTSAPTTASVSSAPTRSTSDNPTWTRRQRLRPARTVPSTRSPSTGRTGGSPTSPYAGFSAATPGNTGHVFTTTDGGKTLRDVTGNLPDVPVNSVVSTRRSRTRSTSAPTSARSSRPTAAAPGKRLGDGIPKVASWQLDFDAHQRRAARRHPRPRRLHDRRAATRSAALVVSKTDTRHAGRPGQRHRLHHHRPEHRQRDGDRRPVTDPLPANTTFVSADQGGRFAAARALGRPVRPRGWPDPAALHGRRSPPRCRRRSPRSSTTACGQGRPGRLAPPAARTPRPSPRPTA